MTTDRERDAAVDRLLGAALRAPASEPDACPPADELAAFVDGALSAPERAAFEHHASGCSRCQQALAALATMGVPTNAAAPRRAWISSPLVRWAVPAGAVLATAALLYVAVRPASTVPEATQMAARLESRAPGGGAASPAMGVSAAPVQREQTIKGEPSPAAPLRPGGGIAAGAPGHGGRGGGSAGRRSPTTIDALSPQKAEAAMNRAAPAPLGGVAGATPQPRQAAAPAQIAPLPALPPPAAAPATAPPAAGPPAAAPPADLRGRVADAAMKQAQAAATPVVGKAAPAVGVPAAESMRVAESVAVATPLVIADPAGVTRWRVDAGTRISRSRDAGVTWEAQPFRAPSEILAGAAPPMTTGAVMGGAAGASRVAGRAGIGAGIGDAAPHVCWLVGREGLVLLTRDGQHWETKAFPERVDLVGIEARDAQTATVTTRDGRRFTTTDGGMTWK